MSFGKRLFELRASRGLSQAELARRAGVARGYVSQLENDRRTHPSGSTLLKIGDALGASPEEMTRLRQELPVYGARIAFPSGTSPKIIDFIRSMIAGANRLDEMQVSRIRQIVDEEIPM